MPDEKTILAVFIENLQIGGKAKFARHVNVSKSTITRWSKPKSDKSHRLPTLENALKIYDYTKSIGKTIELIQLIN